MNINERVAIVLQQIDAALALAEKATKGPWQDSPQMSGYSALWAGFKLLDVTAGLHASDAAFIAASRTGWSAALRCLKTAIEGLQEMHFPHETMTIPEGRACRACAALTTICKQWKTSR